MLILKAGFNKLSFSGNFWGQEWKSNLKNETKCSGKNWNLNIYISMTTALNGPCGERLLISSSRMNSAKKSWQCPHPSKTKQYFKYGAKNVSIVLVSSLSLSSGWQRAADGMVNEACTCKNRVQRQDRLLVGPHRAGLDFGGVWEPHCPYNRQGELWVRLFAQSLEGKAGTHN